MQEPFHANEIIIVGSEKVREVIFRSCPHNVVEISEAKCSPSNDGLELQVFVPMFFLCKQQLLFFGDLKTVSEKLAFYLQIKNL